jgi:tetratricopeptide (TPR) repeat protein
MQSALRPVALALCVSLAVPQIAWAAEPPAEETPEARARRKYNEGSALYSAADYNGAIKAFTEALAIVTAEVDSPEVRGALLLNLAKAHVNAYQIDDDVSHLRQAKEIYGRFTREAESGAGYQPSDVEEARSEITRLETQLEEIAAARAAEPEPEPEPKPEQPTVDNSDRIRTNRNAGIGLLAAGSVLVVGGVVLLGFGTTFKRDAIDQIGGEPPDDQDERDFLDSETQKGWLWMSMGAVVAVLGVAGVATGGVLLAKSKRLQKESRVSFTPVFGPRTQGIVLTGRF